MMSRVEQLMVYPVKSCRGISLHSCKVEDEGLEHDRQWMIVDPQGLFLTQRECPDMARIVPSLPRNSTGAVELHLKLANPQGRIDEMSPELRIDTTKESGRRPIHVWKFEGQAIDCGHQASEFLSEFLRRPVHLVRFCTDETRICNKAWTGELTGRTFFSDGYPILVLGQASVADLASRMNLTNLEIERFRPNIILSGLPAYEEDFIKTLALIGDAAQIAKFSQANLHGNIPIRSALTLRLVKPCPRCPIPKVDPWSGQVAPFDPASELATYRYHEVAAGAVLGMNAMAIEGQGQAITVGQRFETIYDF
jgi:uncharacterized protein